MNKNKYTRVEVAIIAAICFFFLTLFIGIITDQGYDPQYRELVENQSILTK